MRNRVKSLWLPLLANLAATIGLSLLFDFANWEEPGVAIYGHTAKAFRVYWLLAMPLLGALGAMLAKRARASRTERLIAGLAPSLLWLVVLVMLAVPLAFAPQQFAGVPLNDFALSAVGLVILPAAALWLGALPFLGDSRREAQD